MLHKICEIVILATVFLVFGLPVESRAGNADLRQLAQGGSNFALSLYRRILVENKGNILFSPYSISMALSMANAGAKGKTSEEIERALGFTLPSGKLYPALRELSEHLAKAGEEKGQTLSIANASWLKTGFKVQPGYSRLLNDYFNDQSRQLDFCQGGKAAETINDWVAKETHDHIRDLISPGSLNCLTRLVLTNAVYFLGRWTSPFVESLTRSGPFGSAGGQTEDVPLMHRTGTYAYAELEGWQALELPYEGERLAMQVLLPASGTSLDDFEKKLDLQQLERISNAMEQREVAVTFPKFEVKTDYNLNEYLEGVGIREAFGPQADFSGITEEDKLYISAVVHKAWVKVEEKGTEAAAATGLQMRATAVRRSPVQFKADHPFLFLIRDKETGLILFFGRLSSPII
jgi:serpin B